MPRLALHTLESQQSARPAQPARMPQLDGLRALAAIAIVAQHAVAGSVAWGPLYHFQPALAVRLFFVLSGYLITGILLRTRDRVHDGEPLRRAFTVFYARRTLRIFPLYYAVLVIAFGLNLPSVRAAWPWHALYLTNIYCMVIRTFPLALAQYWSLAVEEQFYLVWPALILLTSRRWLPALMVGLIGVGIVAAPLTLRATGSEVCTFVSPLSSLDTLAGGALLAWAQRGWTTTPGMRVCLVAGLVLSLLAVLLTAWHGPFTVQLALARLGTGLLFVWLVDGSARGFGGLGGWLLNLAPLRYVGTISYGVYVYHLLLPAVFAVLVRRLGLGLHWPTTSGADFLAMLAGSVVVATLSWYVFEKPLNDLKRHIH